jgi:amino acid adenylation domain-containing protein
LIQDVVAIPPATEPIFDRRLKQERDYWIARLTPAPRPVAPIPERTRPSLPAGRDPLEPAAAFDLDWPAALGAELRRLARDSPLLVHVALTAALEACLHRLTGERSTWTGSPALLAAGGPGRERQGANAVVAADEIDPRRPFRAHLLQVRETLLAAYARQDYPFLRLLEDLGLERQAGRCPLFDVALSLAGLHADLPETGHGVTLSFALRGEGLAGRAEFDRRRFHRADVARFAAQLQSLLAAALANLDAPLASLEPLTAAERHQLLLEWNDTRAAPAAGPWVHERVAAQAALTPRAVALSWAGGEMTYGQLVGEAHRLARRLRALGVGAEARVGMCLERSPEMAVAVLAILAAGGAYLPLDPALPRQRLAWMVEEAAAGLVVTRQALAPRLPGSTSALCLDAPRAADEAEDAAAPLPWETGGQDAPAPLPRVSGDQLAYVLFTSGSTGRPKGVMVSHRGLLHYLSWCVPAYGAAAGRGAPLHTSIGFDLTVTSLFSPWLAGREVVLVSEQGGIAELAAVVTRREPGEPFSHVKLTPAHLEALGHQLEAAGATGRAGVLVVGGEALREELLAPWRAHWPAARLVNEYGPTEAVVGCCVYEPDPLAAPAPTAATTAPPALSPAAAAPPAGVPIGRPIANTRIDLLTGDLGLAGIGITGELYIGGGGLARGYLRQPELTAERFVPDPWGAEPGARRYRTGDLALRLPDGNLTFVGRADHQVKVRGYRVELGEIESVLRRHPGVRDAAVTAQRDPTTGEAARLVAYVVPAAAAMLSADELAAYLAEQLPEFMRPAAWVTLAALPLTANGKLDRAALPPPAGGTASRPYVAPRNAAEEVMAALWAELLGLERVGARDHFFDLGGHSLLATRLVARLRRVFQVELPLLGLFESPTLAGVVAKVAALRGGMEVAEQVARLFLAVSGLPAAQRQAAFERLLRDQGFELSGAREIPRGAAAETAPLSLSQDGIWFGEQMEGAGAGYNLLAAARLAVPLDLARFERAVDEIVRRHEALRTHFRVDEGVPVQVVAPPRHFPVRLVELAGLPAGARDRELPRLSRGATPLRPDARTAAAGEPGPPGARRIRAAADDASHRLRRLVDGGVLRRARGPLWRLLRGAPLAAARAARAVPRLCPLAAAMAGRRRPRRAARLLAPPARGLPAAAAPAGRPAPPAGRDRARRHPPLPGGRRARRRPAGSRPAGGSDAVHGPADRLEGLAPRLCRAGRRRRRHLLRQPRPSRRGGSRRLLRQHPGPAHGPGRRSDLPPAGGAGAPDHPGSLRAPGPAVLEAGRGARPAARGGAQPAVPGGAQPRQLPAAGGDGRQPGGGAGASPHRRGEVRPGPRAARSGGDARGTARDRHRPVRAGDRRPHARPLPRDPAADGGGPRLPDLRSLAGRRPARRRRPGFQRRPRGARRMKQPASPPVSGVPGVPVVPEVPAGAGAGVPDGASSRPQHVPVHELVRGIAEGAPGRTAIESGDLRITYAELEAHANGLAAWLLGSGAPRGTRVAVLAEDPLTVIPALLAILKIGGVFVPLDPLLPERRLARMAGEAALGWLLVEPAFAGLGERLAAAAGQPRLGLLDEAAAALAGAPPPVVHHPDDPCYLYFTSGSTGAPKAIVGRLKGIDHFIRWEISTLGLEAGTRVSQLTIPTHDPFLRDVFVPLCARGTVFVPPDRTARLDPGRLVAWLDHSDVQLVHAIPSLLRALLGERLHPAMFPGLRWMLLAGEPLLPADARRFSGVFGDRIELVNLYGPTETTLAKLFHRVRPEDLERPSIPIGKPIPGARAVVVDDGGAICPPGVAGEIYIRTPFRSLGYFGRPDLTREVFVPNPFSHDPEDVVYKTGDLGRVRDDGAIEFLGRRDHQVKIRGVRVEPAETESALREHEQVRDAVVVAREDGDAGCSLCAYVVTAGEATAAALRDFLARSLPEVMIPAAIVHLDRLPRTPTGKVDRAALPPPGEPAPAFLAPRTPTEELLAVLWQQLLGRDRVGAGDDFFALGGHSLLALQVLSRVRERFGVEIALGDLLRRRVLSALAARIDEVRRAGRGLATPALRPAPRSADLPLSFAQQRLWFLDRLDPGRPTYNIPLAVRLSGALAAPALARAIGRVVERHEVLRTTFPPRHGWPAQAIAPPAPCILPLVDLAGLPAAAREAQARRLRAGAAAAPFDLERGPLLHGLLLRHGAAVHDLALTAHHIVIDNWSVGVLIREINALYREAATGAPAELPDLPVQYADFAVWQRDWLRGQALEEQLAYWRGRLSDPPVLELPTDRRRPAVLGPRGARAGAILPASLAEGLQDFGRRQGLTLFMTLLAGFAALLHRYSGQDDLVVGTPTANRGRTEIEDLIGFFVNTLALRIDLAGDPGFDRLADRVRETALDAYGFQDVPFEKLVEELQPRRDLSRQPLAQAMLVVENGTGPELALPGLSATPLGRAGAPAVFDLTLAVQAGGRRLPAALDYNPDLFDAATVERLLGHFQALLAGAAATPDLPLSRLPLLHGAERHQLLREWTGERLDLPPGITLHQAFAARAALAPGDVALVWDAGEMTYGELARSAAALAGRLRALGVGPGRIVGLCADRSPELVTGMLGILAAGGAYLPLDPALPGDRLAWMIENARATVVLTQERLRPVLAFLQGPPELPDLPALREGTPIIVLLDPVPAPSAEPRSAAAGAAADAASKGGETLIAGAAATDLDLAYVLYTSGSTGEPKAVMVPHRGACATLLWRLAEFAPGPRDRVLQSIPFTFDPSVWQIFGALLSGARLVLVPPDRQQDAGYLGRALRDQGITIADFPPSLLQVLCERGALAEAATLRCLFVGGETFPPELMDRGVAALAGGLYNIYGPTEACIDIACWDCRREPGGRRVPVGRPIAGKRVLLLDAALEPVPIGLPGELCAGGDGLARGYLGRPDLTAEAFIPDPFAATPGQRLYRTGDRARFRPDGVLELLGRNDRQVKIRGLRVELGEIEAQLGRHPQVLEAAAVVREDSPGDPRLVAYFVARPDQPAGQEPADDAALAAFLRAALPTYMVPGAFVPLAELPVTANGKIDRAALPPPPAAARDAVHAAPRTEMERTIARIWQEALRLEQVSVDDNFFDLGGHSLLMMKVHGLLCEAIGREIPIVDLFTYPSVRSLGRRLADPEEAPGFEDEEQRARLQLAARRRRKARHQARPETEAS